MPSSELHAAINTNLRVIFSTLRPNLSNKPRPGREYFLQPKQKRTDHLP